MSQTSPRTHNRNRLFAIIGGFLIGAGLLCGLLFTIIQLSFQGNANNVGGFIGVMALCPLPLVVGGGILLAIYVLVLRKKKISEIPTQSVHEPATQATPPTPISIKSEPAKPISVQEKSADDVTVKRVAFLVGYLRQFRKNATVTRQPEYEELRKIGFALNERGGYALMREIAHRMAPLVTAPPNPYVGDQVTDSLNDINDYWDGIGNWQA